MTQLIVDNASAMSLDRELTIATTTSQSRSTKYFRKGPIQTTLEVGVNTLIQSTYKQIQAALSAGIAGPYDLTLPAEVIGLAPSHTVTVNGASQTGTTININSTASSTVLTAGDYIQFTGVIGTYTVTADVITDADGDGAVVVDFPLFSSPADAADIDINTDITFSMFMVTRARASQGPTGLVAFDNAFRFVEDLNT